MNTNFKYSQKLFFLLLMGFSLCVFQACSDDDEEPMPLLENCNVLVSGHEAVDLGLSVKWATCNLGSETPEEYGEYYAWGETETKSDYNWNTYKWCNISNEIHTLTKYSETIDNQTTLTPSDDAATIKWGKRWRMPTKKETEELLNKCTWTWTKLNNINGFVIVGPSGRSIFLPAAGSRVGTQLLYSNKYAYYWSSTLINNNNNYAHSLLFYSGEYKGFNSRFSAHPIRPVTKEPK